MLDIVCTPTPFIVGLLSSSLPQLTELPLEEVRESNYVAKSADLQIYHIISANVCFLCPGSGGGSWKQSISQTGRPCVESCLCLFTALRGF